MGVNEGMAVVLAQEIAPLEARCHALELGYVARVAGNEVRRYAESKGVFVNLTPYTWEENLSEYYRGTGHRKLRLVCPKLLEPTARIDHLGNVLFCGVLRKSWGNLMETPFEEIWNDAGFREFRKKLLDGNMLPVCRRCCKVDSLPR